MKRKRSSATHKRDKELLELINPLKADHPAWGYRRIWAYLKAHHQFTGTKNRIYRILKEHRLLAVNTRTLKAKRYSTRPKPSTTIPNQLWGIDMTKIMVESWGWLYLVVVKDWGSKKIVGWDLAPQSKASDWITALNNALNQQFPDGILSKPHQLKLVSDNGCQPTSTSFMEFCGSLGIGQIFTTYSNPKGNADTERLIRTIKEDLIWPRDWFSYQQLNNAMDKWVNDYNFMFPHSSINYQTPAQYEKKFLPNIHTSTSIPKLSIFSST